MLKKTLISSALFMSMAVMAVSPVFAQRTASTAAPVLNTAAVSCVASAVNSRETAIDSAMMAFTQATNAAYAARSTALQQAYALGDMKSIRAGVRKAWSDFAMALKAARKGWQSSRLTAWSQFRMAAKACKAPSTVSDANSASAEASGQ